MKLRILPLVGAIALLGGACGEAHTEVNANSKKTAGAETTQSDSTQVLTYNSGMTRFDPAPDGVTPRMTSSAAYDAWMQNGGYRPEASSDPEIRFALYTDFGQGRMLDSGLTAHDSVNRPAWLIRFTSVPLSSAMGSGGGVRYGGPAGTARTQPPTTFISDVVGVIDDASGHALVTMNGTADNPPYPLRSPTGADPKDTSCPADLSDFTAGLVSDDATPLPLNSIAFTQPHAGVRGSDGDTYMVWGGAGSIEHPLTGPASEEPDGVLVVMHDWVDPCASPRSDEGSIVFHHEPSRSGIVAVTSIVGDTLTYRTAHGVTGTYNVVTESFNSK